MPMHSLVLFLSFWVLFPEPNWCLFFPKDAAEYLELWLSYYSACPGEWWTRIGHELITSRWVRADVVHRSQFFNYLSLLAASHGNCQTTTSHVHCSNIFTLMQAINKPKCKEWFITKFDINSVYEYHHDESATLDILRDRRRPIFWVNCCNRCGSIRRVALLAIHGAFWLYVAGVLLAGVQFLKCLFLWSSSVCVFKIFKL